MRDLTETILESINESYAVFKGEDVLNNVCSNKRCFQDLISAVINACEDYGKPKTSNGYIRSLASDYDKVNKLAKVYSVKDLQIICKDKNVNQLIKNLNISSRANWFNAEVQFLAILFMIAGWCVTGIIDRREIEKCENLLELQELLSNDDYVWDEKYKSMSNFWRLCTTVQQKDVFIAFREA